MQLVRPPKIFKCYYFRTCSIGKYCRVRTGGLLLFLVALTFFSMTVQFNLSYYESCMPSSPKESISPSYLRLIKHLKVICDFLVVMIAAKH